MPSQKNSRFDEKLKSQTTQLFSELLKFRQLANTLVWDLVRIKMQQQVKLQETISRALFITLPPMKYLLQCHQWEGQISL